LRRDVIIDGAEGTDFYVVSSNRIIAWATEMSDLYTPSHEEYFLMNLVISFIFTL
jgi:hypothetical protein